MVGPKTTRLRLVHRLVAHALLRALVLEPVVLQLALAGLVADRAVDRVVEEQELLHVARAPRRRAALVSLEHLHALGAPPCWQAGWSFGFCVGHVVVLLRVPLEDVEHHRALVRRRLDLDQAHAAVRRRPEARVPAVVRDVDARRGARRG